MNLKRMATEEAVKLIEGKSIIGLGDGSTISYMVELLVDKNYTDLKLFTSSQNTKKILLQNNFAVNEISNTNSLDIYFDGCDQFDKDLNALKSGAGIHTTEKLFASMAKQFILVGDDSKYVQQLETKFPVVLEVLPPAIAFVQKKVKDLFDVNKIALRKDSSDHITRTVYGNYLLNVWFNVLPELSTLNIQMKNISGVVETSLFYNLANKAIIAGESGIRILEKGKHS